MRYVAAALLLSCIALAAQSPALEFEVASITRLADPRSGSSGPPSPSPAGRWSFRTTAEGLVLRAYPVTLHPPLVAGAPGWTTTEAYEVRAQGKPDATVEEQQEMWRTLLADRMKLVAHYEMRDRPAYALTLARRDRTLGPQLKRSTIKCPRTDTSARDQLAPEALLQSMRNSAAGRGDVTATMEGQLMSRCGDIFNSGTTLYAGAIDSRMIVFAIRMVDPTLDRPVVDRTGLEGLYSLKLWASRPALVGPPPTDAPPLFSALEEQLGLKLTPVTIRDQVVVIDHIERPTEN